jgi:hypothetical protein
VADITVSGDFTVQSVDEGQYLMAAVYFFRAATKMFFGQGEETVGNPPPMVFLDGYGSHYFPHVPCVITNFTHQLPNEVDYIQVPITSTTLTETPIEPSATNFGSVQGMKSGQDYPSLLDSSTQTFGSQSAQAVVDKAKTTKSSYSSITSSTRVPTVSTISVTLRPMYSRKNLHERFDLNKFAAGALLGDKKTGLGGFL